MFRQVDPRSATPLYSQIASRIKIAIAAGELKPGAGLPSVRLLAAQLRINPATVVQAYRELETEGFVEMRHGAGTFVRDLPADLSLRERRRQACALVRRMVAEAGRLGLDPGELREALEAELDAEATQ